MIIACCVLVHVVEDICILYVILLIVIIVSLSLQMYAVRLSWKKLWHGAKTTILVTLSDCMLDATRLISMKKGALSHLLLLNSKWTASVNWLQHAAGTWCVSFGDAFVIISLGETAVLACLLCQKFNLSAIHAQLLLHSHRIISSYVFIIQRYWNKNSEKKKY